MQWLVSLWRGGAKPVHDQEGGEMALAVECPECHKMPGQPCGVHVMIFGALAWTHSSRVTAAKEIRNAK